MERSSYFDNLKCGLMILVVAGHFLLPLEQTRLVKTIVYLIYTFHMPCFVLVTGYFSKGTYRDGVFRVERLFQVIWLYILFKISVHVTESLAAGVPVGLYIDFFKESGAPWYLLAMLWWYLSLPVVVHLKPQVVLIGSVVFSMLAGYQYSVGSVLVLSRTLAFAPFFYAGYYLTEERLKGFRCFRGRWTVLVGSGLLVAVLSVGTNSFLTPFLEIVYGMGYGRLGETVAAYGAAVRLFWYGAAALLSAGFMILISEKLGILSLIGKNSLQIYILHRLLRDMMQYWGFYQLVDARIKWQVAAVILLACLVAVILGNPHLAVLFEGLKRLPDPLIRRWKT